MPDLGLVVYVTRGSLALGDLDINDHVNYYMGANLLGQQVSYNRQQVTSPWFDGSATVSRSLQTVNQQLQVECLGGTTAELYSNINQLLTAIKQDWWQLKVNVNGQPLTYQCEAADYQVGFNGPRLVAGQVQVVLNVPVQPVNLAGYF